MGLKGCLEPSGTAVVAPLLQPAKEAQGINFNSPR